ncbi:MAG: sigma 54-dependent Fis family transcriptional regulator [Deltaproteobacteria bacterium]|nr:sigma 54-dependent Fis family transcriptional regulator [Deltaproteobacteria bacterium]
MGGDDVFTVADGPIGPDGKPAPVFVLRVVNGPDTGQSLLLDWSKQPSYLVGQGPLCDLRLGDRRVSRRHASIAPEGAMLRINDLRSSNGTRVGGVRVLEALLSGGELVEMGDTQLRVARAPVAATLLPSARQGFGRVVGASFEMQRVFDIAEKLASSMLPVIIEGETGTGKELLAEAIHDAGPRAVGPFVAIDCGGDPLAIEAQLFGREREGAIERAHGGTLLLSEIGDLDPRLQARLLTVVEMGVVSRAGSAESRRIDVRIIATSRRDTDKDVQDGSLKEELMFRLAGARIELPPLRRRYGDVELLARHFWRLYGGEGEPAKALLLKLARAPWPGNVRELQHALARAASLAPSSEAPAPSSTTPEPERAPVDDDVIAKTLAMELPLPRARQIVVRDLERRYVERALAKHDGNVTRAAAACGLTRRYFHVLLAEVRG